MRIVYALFFLFFLVMLQPAFAQTKEVRGTVTDSSGKPLSGASVQVRNSSIGTRTDDDGAFTLQVPQSNSTLVISNIGFEEQQVPVGNQQTLRITMYAGRAVMQEVVVTA